MANFKWTFQDSSWAKARVGEKLVCHGLKAVATPSLE